MTHEYDTDRRVALDPRRLNPGMAAIYRPVTASTQADVKRRLDLGEAPPFLVCAEEQTAGRGRLDRTWSAPPHSSLLMSFALPVTGRVSTLPLRVGVVVVRALTARGVPARLKWPNDIVVLEGDRVRKLGGIICEMHRDAGVVVGIGLNIDMADGELPTPDAISCRQVGSTPSREHVLNDIAHGLLTMAAGADLSDYRELCATLGSAVRVTRVDGSTLEGVAVDVDEDGALVVSVNGQQVRVTAGDVQQLRGRGPA